MPEKVTKEEKLAELTIKAAKKAIEILNEEQVPMKESGVDIDGEDVKLKRPKKKPSEEKIDESEGVRPAFAKQLKKMPFAFEDRAQQHQEGNMKEVEQILEQEFDAQADKALNENISEQLVPVVMKKTTYDRIKQLLGNESAVLKTLAELYEVKHVEFYPTKTPNVVLLHFTRK